MLNHWLEDVKCKLIQKQPNSAEAPEPMPLHRADYVPLLGNVDDHAPRRADHYDGPNKCSLTNCTLASPINPAAAPACCATSGYSALTPNLNGSGVHTGCMHRSCAAVRGALKTTASDFINELLIHDDRHDTAQSLQDLDQARVKWLSTVAKIASRNIQVCCVPISNLAYLYLKNELEKIKNSTPQSATWHGQTRWWLSDSSTQVSGADRAQRIVSSIIRSETESHAFDSTARKKVPKHQKQHDHSLFRQLAGSFKPPGADSEAIASTTSNHPVAGASRRVGVTATRDALHNAGFRMYDESVSGRKLDHRSAGRRELHCIKDLQHPNPADKYKPGMVYTFVDQDMYIDSFEKYAGENMVIITPEYNKLAGVGTDSVWYYTIAPNGDVVVTERVATVNGATYTNQRPWDYSANDFIYLDHAGGAAFTTYNVHIQYQPGSHHKWVWLARNTTTRLSKAVCDMMSMVVNNVPLEGVPLKKASNITVVRGGRDKKFALDLAAMYKPGGMSIDKDDVFLLGLFGDTKSPTFSIKFAYDIGADTSMELTENQYKVFSLMGKNRPKGYGVSEVKRTMQMHSIWRPGGLEPLLVAYFGIPIEYRPRPNIMYTDQAGSLVGDTTEDASAVQGAPNVAGGGPGVADTKSNAAHDAYEKKRLKEYANKVDPEGYIKDLVSMLLPRFVEQISRESGIALKSVTLVAPEVIYERRTQALQAARLKRNAELVAREPMPKTNLKSESAPKASAAPRGITQYTEEMAIQTGRVGLLVKEILKNCEFYQPGNSPNAIAKAVRKLSEMALEAAGVDKGGWVSGLHDTDYSKMDETISKYIYSWFVDFVLAFVHPSDYEEVKKILADNVDLTTLLNGKPIKTGFKNNSGSGVTTELNTFVSAYIEYVSTCLAIVRHMHRLHRNVDIDFKDIKKNTIRTALKQYLAKNISRAGYEEHNDLSHLLCHDFMFKGGEVDIYSVPYAAIGIKFGDDGVGVSLPGISDIDWGAAAIAFTKAIGMILKVSFSAPEDGTFFLGRYYPNPLETLASYADVVKALRKISIARHLSIEKYVMKLRGYWTTDSKTPGIREYLIAVAKMYRIELAVYAEIVDWNDDGTPVLTTELAELLAADREVFYRVAGGPYCVEDDDVPTMMQAIATQVGFDNSSEFESWLSSLAACTTWEELDTFQLPGMDYDPDEDPEGITRMAGPVANLLTIKTVDDVRAALTFDDLVLASEIAYGTEFGATGEATSQASASA